MNHAGRQTKLAALQGLRALAALMVVADHALLNLIEKGLVWDGAETVAYRLGAAGVFIFFVVSGFIMAFTSKHGVGVTGALRFFVRRVWRIVPLYWLATAVYSARLAIGGAPPEGYDIVRSLSFIPYLDQSLAYHPVLGLGWTLNFEMYFYLIFGLSLLLPRIWALSGIALLFGGSIIYGAAMGWNDGHAGAFAKFLTDPIILYFLLGIFIHSVLGLTGTRHFQALSSLIAGVCSLIAMALLASPWVPEQYFGLGMYLVAPALVAIAVAAPSLGDSAIVRLVVLLGDASYSTYLTHGFVIGPLATIAAFLGFTSAGMPFVAAALVICSAIGIACYLFVEKPMLALLRPIFVPSSTPRPA